MSSHLVNPSGDTFSQILIVNMSIAALQCLKSQAWQCQSNFADVCLCQLSLSWEEKYHRSVSTDKWRFVLDVLFPSHTSTQTNKCLV